MLAEYPLHVYVAGDLDIDGTRDLFAEILSAREFGRRDGFVLSGRPAPVEVGAPRHVEETMDVNQAKLLFGYFVKDGDGVVVEILPPAR